MKKIFLTLAIFLNLVANCALMDYYKIYKYEPDILFINALSAIENSKYEIAEIQSKNGYILFLAGSKYYLLTLTKKYQNQTEIKILPQNSEFSPNEEVAKNIFLLLDEKLKTKPMEQIK